MKRTSQMKSATKKPTTSREDGTNQLKTSPRSGSQGDQGGHAAAKAAHWQRRRESRRQGQTKLPTRLAKQHVSQRGAPVSNESIKVVHQHASSRSNGRLSV